MSEELFRKHRPTTFKQVFGQSKAVKQLQTALKADSLPHQLLFTGPSGCGKTTLARILKSRLDCSDRDFSELNCADFRGIDMVRDVRKAINLHPLGGTSRIWLIDEAHKMTSDAQNAFLKMLEEPPSHVYFMLATTDPVKLIKTIQTRCTEVQTVPMTTDAMNELLAYVLAKEEKTISQEVRDKLVECAEMSARKALVILQTVLGLDNEEEQLNSILRASSQNQAILLARGLMNPRITWPEMVKIIKGIDEDPEGLRRLVLAYASNTLIGNNPNAMILNRAYLICAAFGDNFFDTGRAGLIASCYEVVGKTR